MFESFIVIPSIDLKDGRVVRLLRGDMTRVTVYGDDPASTARAFEEQGAALIHVVDLDGAVAGAPRNLKSIEAIRKATGCAIDVSGGLRTVDAIRAAVGAGADYVSIGSAAILEPKLLEAACEAFPGRVFGSLDVRDGKLAIRGWTETSRLSAEAALERFEAAGVAAVIMTDVSRDGAEGGANLAATRRFTRMTGVPLIASGGVAGLDDVRHLSDLFDEGVAGAITGRALYEQRFTLREAILAARRPPIHSSEGC